ncbi:FkbM family methyltransferase [Candidatus Neomarinimicrobiota bacterium]
MLRKLLRRIFPTRLAEAIKYYLLPDEVRLIELLFRGKPLETGPQRVMVDVGAHEGSSLLPFLKMDWRIHAFEPDAKNREVLLAAIKGDKRVTVDERGVSDKDGEVVPFYASDVSSGISGLSAFHETHEPAGTITTVTLAAYIEDHAIENIDFLKVDTEGFELFVIKGIPWEKVKPGAIILEYENAKTMPLGYTMPDLAAILTEQSYHVILSEWQPINRYGEAHSWKRITPYPPADDWNEKGWGNLIAFHERADYENFLALAKKYRPGWKVGNILNRLIP